MTQMIGEKKGAPTGRPSNLRSSAFIPAYIRRACPVVFYTGDMPADRLTRLQSRKSGPNSLRRSEFPLRHPIPTAELPA